MSRTAVLMMAYGTPARAEDLEAYYTHIRRGRPPTPELLQELRGRYEAIGGHSPLLGHTVSQLEGLQRALADAGRPDVHVALGMKHAPPFIEDAVAQLAGEGVHEIVGLVMAPHYSRMSVGEYTARAQAAAAAIEVQAPTVSVVTSWHMLPGYLEFLAAQVRGALDALPGDARAGAHVVFTAHSLPQRILQDDDPYPTQLQETAEALAGDLQLERWSVAWQSAGRTADPWIGPDILQEMDELAAAGVPGVVVCPAGFVSDHLEILYDLDIEAAEHARELGIAFARTGVPNDDPGVMGALAEIVLEQCTAGAAPA